MDHYKLMEDYVNSARVRERGKPIGNNTRVMERGANVAIGRNGNGSKPSYAIKFHHTDILIFHPDGSFTINMGGWDTITTKIRLNEHLPSGFRVGSIKGSTRLWKHEPDNPTIVRRRRRTYRMVKKSYTQAVYGTVHDTHTCVCEHGDYWHQLKRSDLPGSCTYPYMRGGGKCDCPGFLNDQHATKRAPVGSEEFWYDARVPDGWEHVDEEQTWKDLGYCGGRTPMTIDKNGRPAPPFNGSKGDKFRRRKTLAWHCIGANRMMAHVSGVRIRPGETYELQGKPDACSYGFHASPTISQALGYHCGPILCRVELSGLIDASQHDKYAAQRRKVLWMVDLSKLPGYAHSTFSCEPYAKQLAMIRKLPKLTK